MVTVGTRRFSVGVLRPDPTRFSPLLSLLSERHVGEATTGRTKGPVLEVADLRVAFRTEKETVRAVDGVSFDVAPGETLGVVGESGSGKSVTARSILGLINSPGEVLGGAVRYRKPEAVERVGRANPDAVVFSEDPPEDAYLVVEAGSGEGDSLSVERGYIDVVSAPDSVVRSLRGGDVTMVFQDPLTSLNPMYTIGNQIRESLRIHRGVKGKAAVDAATELLEDVGISDARRRLNEYPHQFSGGMQQRAVIATALACDPDVLLCDEPTTALDVTIQAQILDLLADLQRERGMAVVFITHDIGVVAEIADDVAVMYAGEVVERSPVIDLFEQPSHPYTQGLLRSLPSRNTDDRLTTMEGDAPTPTGPPTDCRFAPRCPEAFEACHQVHPEHVSVGGDDNHTAACLLHDPAHDSPGGEDS